jgi:hypothetical protein
VCSSIGTVGVDRSKGIGFQVDSRSPRSVEVLARTTTGSTAAKAVAVVPRTIHRRVLEVRYGIEVS